MIIYMYLTIIVVCSIITGIIVTIIEKKGFYAEAQKSKEIDSNQRESIVNRNDNVTIAIPVIKPDAEYTDPVIDKKPSFIDDDEPILLIDEPATPILTEFVDVEVL